MDEPAAQVVKRIFRLASEGVGYNKMAKIFREEFEALFEPDGVVLEKKEAVSEEVDVEPDSL